MEEREEVDQALLGPLRVMISKELHCPFRLSIQKGFIIFIHSKQIQVGRSMKYNNIKPKGRPKNEMAQESIATGGTR